MKLKVETDEPVDEFSGGHVSHVTKLRLMFANYSASHCQNFHIDILKPFFQ